MLALQFCMLTGLVAAIPFDRHQTAPTDSIAADEDQENDTASRALKELQGEWELIEWEIDGKKIPDFRRLIPGITIRGNDLKYGGPTVIRLKVDPTKSPKVLDLTFDGMTNVAGIYSLEGGKLRMAWFHHDDKSSVRPTWFAGKKGDDLIVFTFERYKKK